MFCSNCGHKCEDTGRFCSNCGHNIVTNCDKGLQYVGPQLYNSGPSTSSASAAHFSFNQPGSSTSSQGRTPSKAKSFSEFRKSKGKEWHTMVSKKQVDKEVQVQIMIGMMSFCEKEMRLKPKRGKRIALSVSNKAPCNVILEKAMDKFKAYHSDIFDTNEDYLLVLENGEDAQFIPGSSPKEFFSLKRYKEDLGKDYGKIVLFLCRMSDFLINTDDDIDEENGKEEKVPFHESSVPKKRKTEPAVEFEEVNTTYESDEAMAIELQKKLDYESDEDLTAPTFDCHSLQKTTIALEDTASVVRAMHNNVKQDDDFFIVTRREAPLPRIISLWQRQARKSCPENVLRVQYSGENGIDTGALSQEFFSNVVLDIGKSMFPDGAPVNSTYNVQNKSFKTCGEIVAASLAQGGPPPSFLAESVYELLMSTLEVNLDQLDSETHFTPKDRELFEQIRNCDSFDDDLRDLILDHGYTGPLDKNHQDDIIGTTQVSIISKRLLYLREFCEGLKLCNVYALVKDNAALCKDLFVPNTSGPVDSDYVFSLVSPYYSAEGTSRRKLEEAVMDNFQDFLSTVEDQNMTGYTEALAWKEKNVIADEDGDLEAEKYQAVDVSPAAVLGWLTGQKHRPVNGEHLTVIAHFDHDCMERNPKHTICFPQVGACSREISFPVEHMTDMKEFERVFLLALCKGGAFSKA